MSDAQTQSEQTKQDTSPTDSSGKSPVRRSRKIPGGRWLWTILMLALLGIGVQQLMAVRFWETLDNEAGQIATVDGRLTALEAMMADQARLREDIQQMQQTLQQERVLLSLERLEQQLDAGWQTWLATGDTSSLIMALQSAQRRLTSLPSASAQTLRLAIDRDLIAIKSQRVMDLRVAVQNIDAVIATIDKLPLIQDGRVPAPPESNLGNISDESVPATLMDRIRLISWTVVQDVWHAISRMVRVQRLDRAEPGLITPEQKVFLQQGLRLLLLDARHALILRNAVTYQQTLEQARGWISKYAEPSDALVKADLATLQQLAALNIDPLAISLENTRQSLTAARDAITGNVLADALPEAAANEPQAAAIKEQKEAESTPVPNKGATQ